MRRLLSSPCCCRCCYSARHILNLLPDELKCQRAIEIAKVHSISLSAAAHEFVVHVLDEYDYHFRSPLCEQVGAV